MKGNHANFKRQGSRRIDRQAHAYIGYGGGQDYVCVGELPSLLSHSHVQREENLFFGVHAYIHQCMCSCFRGLLLNFHVEGADLDNLQFSNAFFL